MSKQSLTSIDTLLQLSYSDTPQVAWQGEVRD
jgi:hypothetical protein